ncbi:MAG: adenylate/guanylate cyclase domain-containing protein, partial [Chloroflexota bacterium]
MTEQPSMAPRWSTLLPRLVRYLPSGLFQKLSSLPSDFSTLDRKEKRQAARTLLEAIRALDPLHRALMQYMPRYLLELQPTPGQPSGELIEGSFLFADVTGFTALTELLSAQGQALGKELMNQIMNQLFTSILDPLTSSGGDLLIFAGDAVLAYFPKVEGNDNDVLQAVRAALRMQRAVAPFASLETEFGKASLTMSMGVERGVAYAGLVGAKQRMELLVSGPGIFNTILSEESGESGQVMLGQHARAIAKDHFTLEEGLVVDDLGESLGDYEILRPTRKVGGSALLSMEINEILETLNTTLQRIEQLAPLLPEDMLARLVNTDRHRQLESEFRPVALQFINIVGIEELAIKYGPELATQVFHRYFVRIQEIVSQHEGVISQIDAYSKGFFLVNTFGVPRAHEGTRQYAVSAALQMGQALDQINREFKLDIPIKQRGGITHGLIFSGEIGAKYRRESVVAGPAVNRAARLMSKAEFGQIILDSDIWEDTKTAFVGEQLPAVNLKGIDGPVVIINVRQLRRGTRLQPPERPLVGRQMEQKILLQALEQTIFSKAATYSGDAWMISGETGIGKTALVADLAQVAKKQEIQVLVGRCQPHGKHIPFFPWIDLISGWLNIDINADPAEQRARLAEEMEELGLADSEGALAELLDLPAVKSQKPRPKQVRTKSGMLDILNASVTPNLPESPSPPPSAKAGELPKVGGLQSLLMDRVETQKISRSVKESKPKHTLWADLKKRVTGPEVIINLLEKLSQREPLLLILEDTHWLDPESEKLLNKFLKRLSKLSCLVILTGRKPITHDDIAHLALDPLSDQALAKVAEQVLGAQGLDDTLALWIYDRSGGNPLYARELCQALSKSTAILLERDTGQVRWTGLEPALPVSLRELLLSRFDELELSHQDVLKRAAVIGMSIDYDCLVRLSQDRLKESEIQRAIEQLVQNDFLTASQDKHYYFTHHLMQETLYETLSFSQRQQWHTQVGDWLTEQPDNSIETVAYHYLHGADEVKGAQFGAQAGDRARELEVYAGAIEFYEAVLELKEAPLENKQEVAERLADVLALQGDYEAAKGSYQQAAELGSSGALKKQVLLTGNLDLLNTTTFDSTLQPWAAGAKAWLLAQDDQIQQGLSLAQETLPTTTGAPEQALKKLIQKLDEDQAIGAYREWADE